VAKGTILEVVHHLEGCLKRQGLDITQVVLFGSQAKGVAKEESDIDIAIVSEDFRGKDIFQRADLTKEAEIDTIKKYLIPLDVITLTPEELQDESSLIAHLVRNGLPSQTT
jgi:predicted nucleotidyltransferase